VEEYDSAKWRRWTILAMNTMNLASTDGSVISTRHLVKVYHMGDVEVPALRGVTLDIARGGFVAVMGPSGSGKSTFMNILGCLDVPSGGEYVLEGVPVVQLSKDQLARIRNEKIGFVFQGFNLLSRTSALENVELPLFYRNLSNKERKALAIEALDAVGLGDRAHHFPNQLSGGQQQRVAVARALVTKPSIILADEPTGNLDSRTSVEIMEIFQRLNESGITIILVTHEPDIARYAKRNVSFKDGRIREDVSNKTPVSATEVLKSMPVVSEEEEYEHS
jgi:putative ABC transport system ATP-binding protein